MQTVSLLAVAPAPGARPPEAWRTNFSHPSARAPRSGAYTRTEAS
jgi:hypothetical protein